MNLIGFGMGHHVPATASAIGGRDGTRVRRASSGCRSHGDVPCDRAAPHLFAGRRTLAGRRRCTAGRRWKAALEELPLCWIEAVLQLGDAVEELLNGVGLLEGWAFAECMVFLLMGERIWEQDRKQPKGDQETIVSIFPVSILFQNTLSELMRLDPECLL